MLTKVNESYFNACNVTLANPNHKIFLYLFCSALVPLYFEKGSATRELESDFLSAAGSSTDLFFASHS